MVFLADMLELLSEQESEDRLVGTAVQTFARELAEVVVLAAESRTEWSQLGQTVGAVAATGLGPVARGQIEEAAARG